jgi:hypothetical protein
MYISGVTGKLRSDFSGNSIYNDRVAVQPLSNGYARRTAENGCRTVVGEGAYYAAITKGKSPITS